MSIAANVVLFAFEFSVAPLLSWAWWCKWWRFPSWFHPMWAGGAGLCAAAFAVQRSWLEAGSQGASAVVALILWWLSRRKRKPVAKLIGAKARAIREKLVKNMPRWEPRLRPVGARA